MTSVLLGFHSTTSQIHPDSTLGHQNSPKMNGNEASTDDVCMIHQVAFVTSVPSSKYYRGTQREYSSKPLKHSIVRLFTVPYFFVRSFRYTASYRHGYLDFQM